MTQARTIRNSGLRVNETFTYFRRSSEGKKSKDSIAGTDSRVSLAKRVRSAISVRSLSSLAGFTNRGPKTLL